MPAAKKSKDPVAVEIGGRIKTRREASGMSQAELGDKVGVRAPTIWRYEAGELTPSADVLDKLADALLTSTRELLRGGSSAAVAAADLVRYPALDAFLATPQGQGATPDEIAELEAEQYSHGSPTVESYSFKLMSIRARARGKGGRDPDPVNPTLPEGTMRRKSKR